MQMKLAVHVDYTEMDLRRLIQQDLAARNLIILPEAVRFRMTKEANRYRLLGAEVEVAQAVESFPALLETTQP